MNISKRKKVFNTLVPITVALGIVVYLLIQVTRGFSASLETVRTQTIVNRESMSFSGYIFRNEKVIDNPTEGIVEYLFDDGEKVRVGSTLANIYPASGMTHEERDDKENALNTLRQQLLIVEETIGSNKKASDLPKIDKESRELYMLLMEQIENGEYRNADKTKEKLNSLLGMTESIKGGSEYYSTVRDQIRSLYNSTVASLGVASQITNQQSGYFYSELDGYEEYFLADRLMSLEYNDINNIINNSVSREGVSHPAGKIVLVGKWYTAVPVDFERSKLFTVGKTYSLTFTDSRNALIDMTLEKKLTGDDNDMLIFSSFEMPDGFDFARAQNIEIVTETCSGYRIPNEAIVKRNGEYGVYVLDGSFVEFRRITRLEEHNGYVIAAAYDSAEGAGNEGEGEYLQINELIITAGHDLYVGKRYS